MRINIPAAGVVALPTFLLPKSLGAIFLEGSAKERFLMSSSVTTHLMFMGDNLSLAPHTQQLKIYSLVNSKL